MTEMVTLDSHRFEEANSVMELYSKGYKPFQIVKELGISRALVDEHINEWRQSMQGLSFMKDRVDELLAQMDDHFGGLLKELHYTLDAIDKHTRDPQLMAQRTAAVKAIAEVTTKRIDAMQKAGLLDAADLGNEIAETEAKVAAVTELVKELAEDCDHCAPIIRDRISKLEQESFGTNK